MSELFELKTLWDYLGHGCLNRYYFYSPETDPSEQEVADSFVNLIVPELLKCLTSDCSLTEVVVKTLLNVGV